MSNREALYRGLSHAAWGYFLLHFDFNLGPVSILPRFGGYLLLLSAIKKLSSERRDLALLRPLCILLAVWNTADWLFSWVGADLDGLVPPLDVLIAVAGLYFHFQFLTDMAALAEAHQPEGDNLNQRLLHRRTAYVVLTTLASALLYLPGGRYGDAKTAAVIVLTVVLMIVAVLVMLGLFELRRIFREEQEEQPDV